ncbi:methyltransferase HEMK2-like [Saccoglossus kowalevskii]|uniref:HemK methyltransferase family member 2-like n=1 Tax=Saccoglossus kowalevskii TaxID=10224 RepID=A0ABM0H123_SACKO|nr:PREDICTED: hemK methyltransferase family member 2-like [Saccoglossus kowalevskii]
MFKTPDYSHITSQDCQLVYEPAEDTFLLLDALEKEFETLQNLRPLICVEVGCGAGVVITFLASLLKSDTLCFGTDINYNAAQLSQKTSNQNGMTVNTIVSDLVNALQPRLNGLIDVLIFNPPYVLTPSEEVGSRDIVASWAGGIDGRQVIDRILPIIPTVLSPKGVFYLLILKENKQDEIEDIMNSHGFEMAVVLQRRTGPERLSVLKFTRIDMTYA